MRKEDDNLSPIKHQTSPVTLPVPEQRRLRVAEVAKVIECPCGVIIDGEGDSEVIAKAQSHAKETHDMELSDDQASSMLRPA